MILPFSHTPQNSTSTPNGVDDVAQPCSPFRASCTPWLTLSEHGWVSSHERRRPEAEKEGRHARRRTRELRWRGHPQGQGIPEQGRKDRRICFGVENGS